MLSIIIPTFNEADQICETIRMVKERAGTDEIEIIVVDGKSKDNTAQTAVESGADKVITAETNRASQMNRGVQEAKHPHLYFLHADTVPPVNFAQKISEALEAGIGSGCFRLAFDHSHWFLKANAWFTQFDLNGLRFGDQSLFVQKDVFRKAGGYREDFVLMEDQEIIHRLKAHGKFEVHKDRVTTSARKYIFHGVFRVQFTFYRIWALYYMGFSQKRLLEIYRSIAKHPVQMENNQGHIKTTFRNNIVE